jgi:predicted RNA-binding protein with PIN domain
MTGGRARVIVVDAANVVGSRPDGWWRDRAGAARKLLVKLAALQERLELTEVVVILEGAARRAVSGPDAPDVGGLRVVLADGSGDDTIAAVTAETAAGHSNPEVTVVTADRGLRQRIEPTGATAVGPRWLTDQLEQ